MEIMKSFIQQRHISFKTFYKRGFQIFAFLMLFFACSNKNTLEGRWRVSVSPSDSNKRDILPFVVLNILSDSTIFDFEKDGKFKIYAKDKIYKSGTYSLSNAENKIIIRTDKTTEEFRLSRGYKQIELRSSDYIIHLQRSE